APVKAFTKILLAVFVALPSFLSVSSVMGTVHVLEAARATPDVRAVVVVTTDKCYENREWPWAYLNWLADRSVVAGPYLGGDLVHGAGGDVAVG
ncbi:hypothetical protein PJK52_28960, partial [Mycobacterium kansasii]